MNADTVVSTLLEDLLDPDGRGLDPTHLAGAVGDMKARLLGMPRYMGAGMIGLTTLFTGGPAYVALPKARRVARVETWRRSRISLRRDFVEFWEKMGTFTYYSRVEKAHSHGEVA